MEPRTFYREEINNTTWEVVEKYTRLKQIGTGAYGSVCSTINEKTKEKVAIKKLHRPFQSEIFAKRAYRELRLLKHMKHENVSHFDTRPGRPQTTAVYHHPHMSYTCPTHVPHMSYTCPTHVPHMSHTCPTPVPHMSHTCPTHVPHVPHVPHMSHTCPTHVPHMSHTCPTHVLHMSHTVPHMSYTSPTHVQRLVTVPTCPHVPTVLTHVPHLS
ncbi:unnamed protein product [Knipowitschia caucasica]